MKRTEKKKDQTEGYANMIRNMSQDPPLSSAIARASLQGLNVFEIRSVRWDNDARTKGKDWNTVIVCRDIKAVWKWLEDDLQDTRVEVRTIHMYGPVCEVIPNIECVDK